MSPVSLLMPIIEQTWQVSAAGMPGAVLLLLVAGVHLRRPDSPRTAYETVLYSYRQLAMVAARPIIYSALLAGTVTAAFSLPAWAGAFIILAGTLYGLRDVRDSPPGPGSTDTWSSRLAIPAHLTAPVIALAALASLPLTNQLTALYLYALVFWRL